MNTLVHIPRGFGTESSPFIFSHEVATEMLAEHTAMENRYMELSGKERDDYVDACRKWLCQKYGVYPNCYVKVVPK